MARSFYETDPDAKAVIDRASELLGMDMPELLFTLNDRLDRTEFTQPAMVTAGIAMLQAVAKTGLKPDVCAGLSLGEYEALYAAGAMSADDAVLDENGRIDAGKLQPVSYDAVAKKYRLVGEIVGNAFSDGKALK